MSEVQRMWVTPLNDPRKLRGYWARLYLEFNVDPCSYEQAVAHLELTAPGGLIVRAKRGPKGGWQNPRYIHFGERVPQSAAYTLHIVRGISEPGFGPGVYVLDL